SRDAFVAKLSPDLSQLVYSTYLGGSAGGEEYALGLAVDSTGHAYVTGPTQSTDFPVRNPIQGTRLSSNEAAFITKLEPNGSQLTFSTYLSGTGNGGYGTA